MKQEVNQKLDWNANEKLAKMDTVSPESHIYGMRHFAVGVTIITARYGADSAGLTATAVCSVTADPPRLVVFVNKNVFANDIIMKSGALCVNVLSSDQEEEAKTFAGMIEGVHGDARFECGTWKEMTTGSPALENALANFDCRVTKVFDESTHHAFLCEVLETSERSDGEALVYLNGSFREVSQ